MMIGTTLPKNKMMMMMTTTTAMRGSLCRTVAGTISSSSTTNRFFTSTTTTTSNSKNTLPIIDMADIDNNPLKVGNEIDNAFRTNGFLYLANHKIPETITDRIIEYSKEFFNQKQDIKNKLSITNLDYPKFQQPIRGYQNLLDNITQGIPDYHEAIDFYRDCPPNDILGLFEQQHPLGGCNKWPTNIIIQPTHHHTKQYPNNNFQILFQDYINLMITLGTKIMNSIAIANNIPKSTNFENYFNDPFWVMRVIKYPPKDMQALPKQQQEEEGYGCGQHTDYGCLTFVLADNTKNCLQVYDKLTNEWIYAQPIDGTFVVNCGDMLSLWTNSKYQSTPHRVISPTNTERIAIPFFFEPNFNAQIQPLHYFNENNNDTTTIIDSNVEPVHYGEHLTHRVLSNFKYSPDVEEKNLERYS